jgi:acetyl esterase/lipase
MPGAATGAAKLPARDEEPIVTRFIDRRAFLNLLAAAAAAPLVTPRRALAQAAPAARTYTYKSAGGCEIQADVVSGDDPAPRPVVIWIHGGGLINGSRKGIPGYLRELAQGSGYAVVSIDYRLAPNTKLPAIIEDIQDAHRWVRREGPKQFGADPDRIVVAGGSAGGYLTLMSGFCFDPRPRALVSFWGYGDITAPWYSRPDEFYRTQPAVPREEAYAGVSGPPVSGATPETSKQRGRFYLYCRQQGLWPREVAGHDPDTENAWFDPYCPIRNVTRDYPPTLLIHGTNDTDVPYQQSKDMAAKLAEAGVEHTFLTVPGAGHGLTGIDPAEVRRINEQAVAFIKAHRG